MHSALSNFTSGYNPHSANWMGKSAFRHQVNDSTNVFFTGTKPVKSPTEDSISLKTILRKPKVLGTLAAGGVVTLLGVFSDSLGIGGIAKGVSLTTGLLILSHTVPVILSHYGTYKWGEKRALKKLSGSVSTFDGVKGLVTTGLKPHINPDEVSVTVSTDGDEVVIRRKPKKA
ncbi:MAG: hypothetical protein K2X01_04100 [Cyanobacteria bacterium]|nr:hypothetical protein [Cyanobacteriota bacterium]